MDIKLLREYNNPLQHPFIPILPKTHVLLFFPLHLQDK